MNDDLATKIEKKFQARMRVQATVESTDACTEQFGSVVVVQHVPGESSDHELGRKRTSLSMGFRKIRMSLCKILGRRNAS